MIGDVQGRVHAIAIDGNDRYCELVGHVSADCRLVGNSGQSAAETSGVQATPMRLTIVNTCCIARVCFSLLLPTTHVVLDPPNLPQLAADAHPCHPPGPAPWRSLLRHGCHAQVGLSAIVSLVTDMTVSFALSYSVTAHPLLSASFVSL